MESTTIIPARLVAKARELALPDTLARDLLAAYSPFASAITDIKAKIAETDALTPEAAREFRLATVKIRTGSDKVRKDLKADSLLRGKAIDGLNALVEIEATAVEKAMEDIERAAARAEAARVLKLRDERRALIAPYVADPAAYLVEGMSESVFAELLETSKLAAEARAKAKAEADRAEAERAEAARKAAAAAEAERLETARREAAENAKRQAEEAAAAAARAAAKAAADALAAAVNREADAKAAAERAEASRKAEAERAAKAAAEQAKRIEQMEAAAKATRLREEAEARDAEARAEARRRKQEEDRKAVVARIAADLGQLKRDGKISSMTALAECIVSGGLRGVTVEWDAA